MNVSDKKAQLLKAMLKKKGISSSDGRVDFDKITRLERLDGVSLPLSYAQEQLWFQDQLFPGSPVYNIPEAVYIQGKIDIAILEQGFQDIINRHESLRTNFKNMDSGPASVVKSQAKFKLNVIKYEDSKKNNKSHVLSEIQQQVKIPFDLENDLLIRASIWDIGSDEYYLLITIHHIVCEGWSVSILLNELGEFYSAREKNEEPTGIKELPVTYIDFSQWQRNAQKNDKNIKQLDYWKKKLSGDLPVTELPMDFSRPSVATFNGAIQKAVISNDVSSALLEFCNRNNVTSYMALIAVFNILISRYSGLEDVLIGTPISSRSHKELENVIGFFVNTIVLRTDLSGNPVFEDFVQQIRSNVLEAFDHQDTPLGKLVDELHIDRDLSYNPVFQVMFALQNVPEPDLKIPGAEIQYLPHNDLHTKTTKVDINMVIEPDDSSWDIWVEYNTDIFNEETISRFINHYINLLKGVVKEPGKKLHDLSMLTDADFKLLEDSKNTYRPYAKDKCIHQIVSEQAQKYSDAIAISFNGADVSYQELEDKSTQLAAHLSTLNIKPDQFIGLCVNRSADMLIAMLAILKSGAAYLPLDPEYPAERIEFILNDADVSVLITETDVLERLPENQIKTILLDSEWSQQFPAIESVPEVNVAPDNLAYTIYTSGSTGKPKGVLVPHKTVVNFLNSMSHQPGLTQTDVLLAVTTLSFDIAVLELFLPLFTGARIILADRDTASDGMQLAHAINEYGVNVMQATPATWRLLFSAGWKGADDFKVLCGGEAMPADLAEELVAHTGSVWNMYGPTETTVWSSCYKITDGKAPILIGKPIDNTSIFVLDKYMQQQAPGIPGELFIGGAGVTRGYHNRDDLTQERFVSNPFSDGNDRLYRTGDLVCLHEDGNLEYINRLDNQVKVRGFRIELGEIETTLSSSPVVSQSVVVVREDQPGDVRLVAYYVISQNQKVTVTELRDFLQSALPAYMIPQLFIELDELPVTPNGKIDRKALPQPADVNSGSDTEYVAAEDEIEKSIVAIWESIIGINGIGVNDDFFAIGGHSLLATQVISRIKNDFDIELPLRTLFDAPSVAKLAVHVKKLSGHTESSSVQRIEKNKGTTPVALSFAQQRLWYLDQLDPDNPVYNVPMAYFLDGALNVELLTEALKGVFNRHDILKTSFQLIDDEPVQHIEKSLELEIENVNLSDADDKEVENYLAKKAGETFSLNQSPLIKISILQLADNKHMLFIMAHHTIFDGWSIRVFMNELRILYKALTTLTDLKLPDLPVQYSDFSVWQRNWLQDDVLDQQLEYWKSHLHGELPVLELPADYPRPGSFTYAGKTLSANVSESLMSSLVDLSRAEGATVFMVAFTAYISLLYRYTGQTDIISGTVIANRNHAEIENLLGYFTNTLAIRTTFDEPPEFVKLLSMVREACLGAYTHQDLPFEKLVEELNPERDLSHTPIFQTLFSYEEFSDLESPLEGDIKLNQIEIDSGVARTDLSIAVQQLDKGSGRIVVEYCSDIYKEETVSRLIEHYINLLQSAVETPKARLYELPMLTDAERQSFDKWNNTASEYDSSLLLHQKFEQLAKTHPENIAIEFEGAQLSYKELDKRASDCAKYLNATGVKQGDFVGVFMLRSIEMMVAIYGTLKAGAAYIPIDPDYPEERINYIVADANINFVLTHKEVDSTRLNADHIIDINNMVCKESSLQNKDLPQCSSDSVAYVIYTSGTTGNPKGVMISHKSIINRLEWMQKEYTLDSDDIVLQKTPYSFDVSVWELFWPLMTGAKLQIAKPGGHKDPAYLKQIIKSKNITTLHFVPSMLKVFLDVESFKDCDSLKRVYCSGEALPYETTQQFFNDSHAQLHNLYGPTEAAVDVTYWQCKQSDSRKLVPIGVPVSNTQLYILDAHQQQVPVGVVGELYIGGDQVAKGYLNKPDLTEERFLVDAFAENKNVKMYRTGDLVRYLDAGEIEYIGRTDFQVKIRGFRIEPGEIEARLNASPEINQSVVAVQQDAAGNPAITAYYIVKNASDISADSLRSYLAKTLPDYMVPQYFIAVDDFALTSNGKIDRKALPLPDGAILSSAAKYIAPSNDIEKIIAEIWENLTGISDIGINDNFFAIGGHSLLATQVVSRIKNHFDIDLPLRSLFDASTVAELSVYVKELLKNTAGSGLQKIDKNKDAAPVALSFAQQRLWYLDQLDPDNPVYNVPVVYQLKGTLDTNVLAKSIGIIFKRHDALKTSFQIMTDEPVQNIEKSLELEIESVNLVDTNDKEVENYLAKKAGETFSLNQSPLIRVSILQLADNKHMLFIMAHHTIFDGWSIRVFINELRILYEAFLSSVDPKLPELPVQYSDFSVWQRNWLQGDVLDQQLEYWKQHLHGELPVLELPTDYPRPSNFTYAGKTISAELPANLMASLSGLSRSGDATIFMLTFAAYITLLYRYTGQTDIIAGTVIANRNHSETENLIGYFANTLAIRTSFDEPPEFTELLSMVRESCLGAYTHQDLPFEKLVEELNPERELSHTPVFQTLFAYEDSSEQKLSLADIELNRIEIDNSVAHTDLSLAVQETESGKGIVYVEYCSDLFKEESVERLIEHYINLLQSIVQMPEARLHELSMLTDNDVRLIEACNKTSSLYPENKCIHQIVSEQAKQSPEKTAISFNGTDVSYQELEEKSDRLAAHLSSLNIKSDQLIALCVNRSTDMLVAMLAILKAGAAYLPLDPEYPAERIEFILEDADVSVIVTESTIVDILPDNKAKTIFLDKEWDDQFPSIDSVSKLSVTPDNLAYTIYTSGSTGKPKGVLVPHSTVVNFLTSMADKPGLMPNDILLAVTTLSFDIAVLELFLPLFSGAKIELADRETAADGDLLLEKIASAGITVMQATPATWRLMLASGWKQQSSLKVLCGGEAMPADLAIELVSHASSVWNMYGPTETTVWSTVYQVEDPQQPILIGKPIANTQIHILDENMQQLPAGVAGEMYIGGAGVTRGYLNRDKLTQERFIEATINGAEPVMLYRTGDLVRYKADGNIEYINRLDNQVKVRGFRIELGEIENVLADHPEVNQVVVIIREDRPGDTRLVAYYVGDEDTDISVTSLRKHLRMQLPDYMIPQHFVELEVLPVTPNGKINRKALPAPFNSGAMGDDFVAPSTENEKMLAEIWKDILDVERVSINDNFFELGGHSLLSVQVVARVREKTGMKLELRPVVMDTLGQIAAQCPEAVNSESANDGEQQSVEKSQSFIGRIKKKVRSTLFPSK